MKNRLGILICIYLHQVLDHHDVSIISIIEFHIVHDFTLLLFSICWLLQPIYAIVCTNSLLLFCLCWLFQPLVKTIHTQLQPSIIYTYAFHQGVIVVYHYVHPQDFRGILNLNKISFTGTLRSEIAYHTLLKQGVPPQIHLILMKAA